MKILGIWTRTTKASFSNRIQETKDIISGTENTEKEMDTLVKGNIKLTNLWHKTSRNLEQYETTESMYDRNREMRMM